MNDLSRRMAGPDGILLLEDGSIYSGWLFGDVELASRGVFGEAVFNTSLTGYQEVFTDPSYWQQIVVMTYPHQGNYGWRTEDDESRGGIQAQGVVVGEADSDPRHHSSEGSLGAALLKAHRVGIEGVRTRDLVLHLRQRGVMRAVILSRRAWESHPDKSFWFSRPESKWSDYMLPAVSTKEPYWYSKEGPLQVVVLDFGVKTNLLRELAARGASLVVVPAHTSAAEILSYQPHGVFLSNGPGDPAGAEIPMETVRNLMQKAPQLPLFGVCMGHQVLALALGAKTYKMKFGHRGGNQPVLYRDTGLVEISSHNHGYAVDSKTLPQGVIVTHENLNDGCCEGLRCQDRPVFSVQYHPEAAPGPHDSAYLFDQFVNLMKKGL